MSEIEVSPTYDKFQDIQEAGTLSIKGYSNIEIAEILEIDPRTAGSYVNEYTAIIRKVGEDNPYFLEEIQFNTLKIMEELNQVSKEAWETVNIATDGGMVTARIQALKLALDVTVKKGNALNLLSGGNTADGEYIARMQRAETVNSILAGIMRDIISECDVCNPLASDRIKEAFALIEQSKSNDDDIEDAILVDDS